MRRLLPVSLALVLILVLSPLVRAQIATVNSDPEYGFIQVTLDKKLLTAKIKVLIEKNDDRYFYAMNHQQERFPLQLGTGIYKVHILEQVEGNKYKFIQSEELNIRSLVPEKIFANSVQNISWEEAPQVVTKAQELTRKASSDRDKLELIYNFVIDNIKYDYKKAEGLPPDYLPHPEETYVSGKGICYDYASLCAAMLRSIGIPAKLVMGKAEKIPDYHAWNEVYIDGEWLVIDTTFDAKLKEVDKSYDMIKERQAYQATRVY
jgi:transglutaminase-like putative cysteine protease